MRFHASHWHVQEIDGHDTDAIRDAIRKAQAVTDQPSMISCRTVIGFGLPTRAGTQKAHSDAPGEEEIAGARKLLNWTAPPFVIPEPLLQAWRAIGAKGRDTRMAWADRVKAAPDGLRQDFERRTKGELPANWRQRHRRRQAGIPGIRQGTGHPSGQRRRAQPPVRRHP